MRILFLTNVLLACTVYNLQLAEKLKDTTFTSRTQSVHLVTNWPLNHLKVTHYSYINKKHIKKMKLIMDYETSFTCNTIQAVIVSFATRH